MSTDHTSHKAAYGDGYRSQERDKTANSQTDFGTNGTPEFLPGKAQALGNLHSDDLLGAFQYFLTANFPVSVLEHYLGGFDAATGQRRNCAHGGGLWQGNNAFLYAHYKCR